jgi:hypothetical protein
VMIVEDKASEAKRRLSEFNEEVLQDPWGFTKAQRNAAESEYIERQMNGGRPAAPEPDDLVFVETPQPIEVPTPAAATGLSRAERNRLYTERMAQEAMRG